VRVQGYLVPVEGRRNEGTGPLAARDDFPKGVHECRPFVRAVGREVDRSTNAGAGDFYPLGFRSGDVGEVFDRVNLCDGGVVDLSDESLVDETTPVLAREKREECRFASVDPEQRDRLTGPLEHGQRVRTDRLPVKNSSTSERFSCGMAASLTYSATGSLPTGTTLDSRSPTVALAASAFAELQHGQRNVGSEALRRLLRHG
jgi:hypothetical protein